MDIEHRPLTHHYGVNAKTAQLVTLLKWRGSAMRDRKIHALLLATRTLEDLPQLLFLCRRQGGRELDIVLDDKVSSLAWLLGDGHAEIGIDIGATRLSGSSLVEAQLLAVDRGDGPLPTREGLLEI
jgi:hypothetical protein